MRNALSLAVLCLQYYCRDCRNSAAFCRVFRIKLKKWWGWRTAAKVSGGSVCISDSEDLLATKKRLKGQEIIHRFSVKSSSLLAHTTKSFFINDVLLLLHFLTLAASQFKVPCCIFGFFFLCHLLLSCIVERLVLLLHM